MCFSIVACCMGFSSLRIRPRLASSRHLGAGAWAALSTSRSSFFAAKAVVSFINGLFHVAGRCGALTARPSSPLHLERSACSLQYVAAHRNGFAFQLDLIQARRVVAVELRAGHCVPDVTADGSRLRAG